MLVKSLFLFLLLSFCSYCDAFAKNIGQFHSWTVIQSPGGAHSSCYIIAHPYKTTGKVQRSQKPYLMVAMSQKRPFVSLYLGKKLKDLSQVKICPGGQCSMLYAKKNRAWSPDNAHDLKIIEHMKKYNFLQTSPLEKKGLFKDHYALKGFKKAYNAMLKCQRPS